MKRFFAQLGYKFNGFMQGRYGYDELSRCLSITGLLTMIVSGLPYIHFLYIIAFAMLIWAWFRTLSRNIYKRQIERNKYLMVKNKLTQKFRLYKRIWKERKTHKYYKCPGCKTTVRIVKPEKGRTITITCPKCRQSFKKRT